MAGAVFLSYASQDVEAARRIAEALRTAGVEVWFDQSELRGGDAWDAKIRRQIKECALFVPVISESTNRRAEGYFRLEWKLAVDRSHTMAEDTPFILPVVLGDISAPAARVPDKFREIQWTRLSLTVGPAELAGRIVRVLGGEPAAAPPAARPGLATPRQRVSAPHGNRLWWAALALVAAGVAIVAYFHGSHQGEPGQAGTAPVAATPVSEAQQLAAKAQAMYYMVAFTRSDLSVAEGLARQATESDPNSAYAWGVRAGVQAAYIQRYWALDDGVRRDTEAFAKRALALDPEETQALAAMGFLLFDRQAYAEAEVYLRHAYRTAPKDNRIARMLGRTLEFAGRFDEGWGILEKALERDPRDSLAHYDLSQMYAAAADNAVGASAQADRAAVLSHLQASLAIQPNDSVLAAAARFVGPELGDVAGMRSFLDRVTPEGRGEDRTIYTFMMCGLLERAPDRVLAAAALSMSEYFEDSIIAQPKAWSTALAYRLAGKENLARLEWQNAESTLRQHLQQHPSEVVYQVQLATTLAWLGRRAEAEQFIGPAEPIWREQLTPYRAIGLARYYAALGDAAKAVPLLQFSLGRTPSGSKWMLKLYPWWDKLRGQPEFEALLAQAFASQPKN